VVLRIVEEAGLTDVGRQRTTNEDAYLESAPMFAVADGMGGAQAGEVASRVAVETFAGEHRDGEPEARLAEVAHTANRKIYELAQQDESRSGMGTTFTAAIVAGGDVAIGHVGDSRLYRLRDRELERLTRDHSLVEELVRQGKLEPEAAESHPQRSIITRALGPEPEVEVETLTTPGRDGDVYLLCSDGLTGMISEEEVTEILVAADTLDDAARRLVGAANETGGKDNVTVVLFRLGGDDEASADADTLVGQETRTGLSATAVREAAEKAELQDADRERPEPPTRATARPPSPSRSATRRARRLVAGVVVLLIVAILAVGLYVGSRQFYFVGTSDQGLVTLYRGLPYDLPAGISLYEEEYTTSVSAASIDRLQRESILDHELRSRGDAIDLIRQLEQDRLAV
jgi:protein phosphatase